MPTFPQQFDYPAPPLLNTAPIRHSSHIMKWFLLGGILCLCAGLFFFASQRPHSLALNPAIQTHPSLGQEKESPVSPSTTIVTTTVSVEGLEPLEPVATSTMTADIDHAIPVQETATNSHSNATSTQYVVLAFDGSRSIDMWRATRDFAKEMAAKGAPIQFTYFINTSYLLAYSNRMFYAPPQHATGTSPIGFASSEKDVANRLAQMNAAEQEGHEIGCHLTGHYDGSSWSEKDWSQEFKSFFDIVSQVGTLNHLENEPLERRTLQLPPEGIVGFRAPDLGVNEHLWPVLKRYPFAYDTSLTDKLGTWPSKRAHGLWEFPLTKIPFAGSTTSSLLSMDYNFYFKQSKAIDVAKRGTALWDEYYNQVLTSYRDYFAHSYNGNHAPLFIGHHFSLWNDGVYWEAMKTFAEEVCGKPGVKCVSYKEVMQALNNETVK